MIPPDSIEDDTMEPRQALKAYREQAIEGHALLRILTGHNSWRMLAVEEDDGVRPLLRIVGEDRWLQLFTDEGAFSEHIAARGDDGAEQGWVETTGEWLFDNIGDELAGIDINPLLDDAIHYKREQFDMLRSWAASLKVERVLAEQKTDEDAARAVASARFFIAFISGDAGPQLALAPDPQQNRQFAAVFTAPDAALEYTTQASTALGQDLKLNAFSGAELFHRLAKMPLDGLVFNCLGPTPPVAVSIAFAKAFAAPAEN